tara:strand:+ start:720 stop:1331 length:612 start_codon:yes stop_codon:yes gene_type:complete
MNENTDTTALFKAIQKFHKTDTVVNMTGYNPRFKSAYATLADIQKALRPPLLEAGLIIVHQLGSDDMMTSSVIHVESGQSISSTFKLHLKSNDIQAWGGAITYAKRYAISALLDIITEPDDDANKATDSVVRTALDNRPKAKSNTGGSFYMEPVDDANKQWLNNTHPEYENIKQWVRDGGNPYKIRDTFKVNNRMMDSFKELQ